MAKSDNLRNARKEKKDEFYTQLADIELEIKNYKTEFFGKIVFCNCDDPFESNFFKYFAMNFNHLGLKKLICTCYATSPVAWTQLSLFENESIVLKTENGKQPYKIEITEVKDYNGDGAVDLADVEYLLKNEKNSLSVLNGDGDFRSEECIDLLKQSDTTADIPYDYNGIMGVPITFMDKYNPEQFEIIGMGTGDTAKLVGVRKNYRGRTDLSYTVNGKQQCPYNRILIRRKQK